MKRIMVLIIAIVAVLGFAAQSHASLTVVGTDSLGNQLIYDSALNVTWYDYTYHPGNGTTWSNAENWANNLTVNFNGRNITGWTLPTSFDGSNAFGHDGTTAGGYNIKDPRDQLSYLYYAE